MFAIEPITAKDQEILWSMLYEALWDPPNSPRRPRACLADPIIAAYAESWGTHTTDLGFKAVLSDGAVAGMVWSRLLLEDSGAFFNAKTPQLGIAVSPMFQNCGVGRQLIRHYLDVAATQFPGVSLSVHPQNWIAIQLYKRFKFKQFAIGKTGYLKMYRDFLPPVAPKLI